MRKEKRERKIYIYIYITRLGVTSRYQNALAYKPRIICLKTPLNLRTVFGSSGWAPALGHQDGRASGRRCVHDMRYHFSMCRRCTWRGDMSDSAAIYKPALSSSPSVRSSSCSPFLQTALLRHLSQVVTSGSRATIVGNGAAIADKRPDVVPTCY